MTLLEYAEINKITPLVAKVAKTENIPAKLLLQRIKTGRIVIPKNVLRQVPKPCGIGFGLRTKINANIGTSTEHPNLKEELEKLCASVKLGADTVMDLSVGGDLKSIRREILKYSLVPVGTVPIYEIAVKAKLAYGDFLKFSSEDIFQALEAQAKEGVDFFTIHAGVTRNSLKVLEKNKRLLGIVSRGGAILASWMRQTNQENPFYEYFNRVLDIAYKYDITLSLGDGMRPGSILDATDQAQIAELKILGELALMARKKKVQVIIEGPGHVPIDQIEKNIRLQKKLCHQAPFYILGPLVTDVAAGYDHITSAIGSAIAAGLGADFLCYVTPAEHLRHPSLQDVKDGVIAAKIAAHSGDLVKNAPQAKEWDQKMSQARKKRDWKTQIKLSIDPEKAASYRKTPIFKTGDTCTMCGDYCSIKLMENNLRA